MKLICAIKDCHADIDSTDVEGRAKWYTTMSGDTVCPEHSPIVAEYERACSERAIVLARIEADARDRLRNAITDIILNAVAPHFPVPKIEWSDVRTHLVEPMELAKLARDGEPAIEPGADFDDTDSGV